MSGKTEASIPKTDRRVRQTRDSLGDALIALIQEKPFETITVQQVLDRAGVGRSTFYTHYRDKDDLLLSDMEDFLEPMSTLLLRRREVSTRVAPVREFFAHIGGMRPLYTALMDAGKLHDFLEMTREYFARAIEQRLAGLPASQHLSPAQRVVMAHAFSGALLALMSWWIDHGTLQSPEEMDDFYYQIVWSGVSGRSLSFKPMPLA